MQRGLIITCPRCDNATEYLTYYSKSIVEEAEKRSIKFKEIHNKVLDMTNFSEIVTTLDYQMIVFNGHGSKDSIFGYKDNIIIQVGKNEDIIRERIIYARACNAAVVLGVECMKNTKNGCFIGYSIPFVFFMDESWISNPHNDNVAKLFLIPSNMIPLSLIKGNPTIEAHENSKKQILKNINRVLRDKDKESFLVAEALWNNYIGQTIIGNNSAKLED